MIDQDFDFEEWANGLELDFELLEGDLGKLIYYINGRIPHKPFWAGVEASKVQAAQYAWTGGRDFTIWASGDYVTVYMETTIKSAKELHGWCDQYLNDGQREIIKKKFAVALFLKM